jgi:hypothetical protein
MEIKKGWVNIAIQDDIYAVFSTIYDSREKAEEAAGNIIAKVVQGHVVWEVENGNN